MQEREKMPLMKALWLATGVSLLALFVIFSFWGIPAPLALIEKPIPHERLSQNEVKFFVDFHLG